MAKYALNQFGYELVQSSISGKIYEIVGHCYKHIGSDKGKLYLTVVEYKSNQLDPPELQFPASVLAPIYPKDTKEVN